MDLKEKVTQALRRHLRPDHIHLEDDEGISGVVVSEQFRRIPAIERQTMIHKALHDSSLKFTKAERSRILAIAGLTNVEYAALGRAPKSAGVRNGE